VNPNQPCGVVSRPSLAVADSGWWRSWPLGVAPGHRLEILVDHGDRS
jgi:hypothetical protein